MATTPPAVPQAITSPPVVPKHVHWFGPCRKMTWGNDLVRYCVIYPGCRAYLYC